MSFFDHWQFHIEVLYILAVAKKVIFFSFDIRQKFVLLGLTVSLLMLCHLCVDNQKMRSNYKLSHVKNFRKWCCCWSEMSNEMPQSEVRLVSWTWQLILSTNWRHNRFDLDKFLNQCDKNVTCPLNMEQTYFKLAIISVDLFYIVPHWILEYHQLL